MRKSRFSEEQIVAALQLVASARRSASSDAVPEPAARGARTPRGPSPSGDGTTALCYRRLHVMLKRRGWTVNRKLVLRLVRENGWLVRRKLRNKLAAVPRIPTAQPSRPNEAWAMDFVFDGTAGGRTFRSLNVIDRFTRECLVIEVDTSMTGQPVVAVLALVVAMRGRPQRIRI